MPTDAPRMFYFGPWDGAGHYLHDERGYTAWKDERTIPWTPGELDGKLQPHFPGCAKKRPGAYPDRYCGCPSGQEGPALLHHRDGWTALAFWDRSVDTRGACNSVYIAHGDFSFEQMVEMAKARFAFRWNKMKFDVTPAPEATR
jgi:hypothetical protein